MAVMMDPSLIHDDDDQDSTPRAKAPPKPAVQSLVVPLAGATPKRSRALIALTALLIIGAAGYMVRGKGLVTRVVRIVNPEYKRIFYPPRVATCVPAEGDVGFIPSTPITINVDTHDSALVASTVNEKNIAVFRTGDFVRIAANVSLAPDGKQITVEPKEMLDDGTNYTVYVGNGVKDVRGMSFVPFASSFNTKTQSDPAIAFEQLPILAVRGAGFTALVMGADGKLYGGTDDGRLMRFAINPDGTLGEPETFAAFKQANGGSRLILGFCFDPKSTPENPTIYITSGLAMFENCPDFSCKLTRVSGAKFDQVQDVLVNLPRAIRDHQSHQPSFGPDGAIYFQQGSSSAYGEPDAEWGDRPEHLLTANLLRLDLSKLPQQLPLDVKTVDAGGSYDPRNSGAPLTIYASGIRLAYDMCWHSNGNLYLPVNGSSAGGNTPAGNGAPALRRVAMTEHDWLFKVAPGAYYGHPNPTLKHYVLNGGNPTGEFDQQEIPFYPVGTLPDSEWAPAAYDFGSHISADGCLEYKSNAFGGALKGALLVCRYNVGSDVIALLFDAKGEVRETKMGIRGLTGFNNPLDIAEDPRTGCLYISEYGARKLTLARPMTKK